MSTVTKEHRDAAQRIVDAVVALNRCLVEANRLGMHVNLDDIDKSWSRVPNYRVSVMEVREMVFPCGLGDG